MKKNNISHTVAIDEERKLEIEEVESTLTDIIDAVYEDEDISTIIMSARPTETEDEAQVKLTVYGPEPRLIRSMCALLEQWVAENIPAPGPAN